MSLLIDNRLQIKLGTSSTKLRARSFDITSEPILVTFDSDPFAILIVKLFGHALYVSNIVASLIMWSNASKSMIQCLLPFLHTVKALKELSL